MYCIFLEINRKDGMRGFRMLPKVSIVIPFYNCPYIDQAINSALNQTYPNVEVIVVDDGSTQHAERIVPFLNHIHYIGKANGGTASALNYGIRLASGEYIAWLSSDDLFYRDKLKSQVSFMLEQSSMISYTAFDQIDAYNYVTKHAIAPRFASTVEFYRSFLVGDAINGCTIMVKKDLMLSLGGFNEGLPFTHDYDLWIRMILKKIPFHFLDKSLTMYRYHSQMGTIMHHSKIVCEIKAIQDRYSKQIKQLVTNKKK
jgi:teichuronic acid biosynthesis glycosyltransferase TuaG